MCFDLNWCEETFEPYWLLRVSGAPIYLTPQHVLVITARLMQGRLCGSQIDDFAAQDRATNYSPSTTITYFAFIP